LVKICSCPGGEQDPVTAVSQIEDRIANNTSFTVNCFFSYNSFNTLHSCMCLLFLRKTSSVIFCD